MFLLDTNVISEFRKTTKVSAPAREWVGNVRPAEFFLSAISILEVEIGARRVARRDKVQAEILFRWIEQKLLPSFRERILPVDVAVARRCAELHVPDPRPERDALIAATALVNNMTLVTRNVRDFAKMGVTVLNPFEG